MTNLRSPANDRASATDTAVSPAERKTPAEVEAGVAALTASPLVRALLDAADVSVVLLNRERQILAGNSALLQAVGAERFDEIAGTRPGEAFGCVHAMQCTAGCETAPECSTCGAVLAILRSQDTGKSCERECLMTIRRDGHMEARELHVKASQVEIAEQTYTLVGLRDISAEKRRQALERIFLHDLGNTVGSLVLRAHTLAAKASDPIKDSARTIAFLSDRLRGEIEDQRILLLAESGALATKPAPVQPSSALRTAAEIMRLHPVAQTRTLEVLAEDQGDAITTDEALLVRVLVNMIKNALEATPNNGVVRAWLQRTVEWCEFRVWNAGVIPAPVALQIFKRSFTTKTGLGRGTGTFSMKLLGEEYLAGQVGFTSREPDGTTFFLRLPV